MKNPIQYNSCELCPRNCKINRNNGQTGVCQMTNTLKLARAALHFWEEPCISGDKGSGAVFFSGCSLRCVFCQNEGIAKGQVGKKVPPERLSEIFFELKEKGANNINLVTPGHFVPHIVNAIEKAKAAGFDLPFVYNTSSYEAVDTIKALEGLIDVYLPDFKYMSPELSLKYSHAKDYPEVAKAAIAEMVRQQPQCVFKADQQFDEPGMIQKGVIVRQLLLPNQVKDAMNIVKYLHQTYGNQIYISMMSQFTPLENVKAFPELCRKVTHKEYEKYIDYALEIGLEQGFIQEEDVAEESFIPHFDCEGV